MRLFLQHDSFGYVLKEKGAIDFAVHLSFFGKATHYILLNKNIFLENV